MWVHHLVPTGFEGGDGGSGATDAADEAAATSSEEDGDEAEEEVVEEELQAEPPPTATAVRRRVVRQTALGSSSGLPIVVGSDSDNDSTYGEAAGAVRAHGGHPAVTGHDLTSVSALYEYIDASAALTGWASHASVGVAPLEGDDSEGSEGDGELWGDHGDGQDMDPLPEFPDLQELEEEQRTREVLWPSRQRARRAHPYTL